MTGTVTLPCVAIAGSCGAPFIAIAERVAVVAVRSGVPSGSKWFKVLLLMFGVHLASSPMFATGVGVEVVVTINGIATFSLSTLVSVGIKVDDADVPSGSN